MSARFLRVAVLAIFVFAAVPVAAATSAQSRRPRPAEVPPSQVVTETAPNGLSIFNDYATAERTFSSRQAVVHYVVVGIDAPPLNDDDLDGTPDYVERAGEAADRAITYFERRSFAHIRADTGGPDGRPDLYVTRFAPGYLGVSLPACDAEGGAFVALANNLDPSAGRSFASLYGTVAHEVFHLVQFSYFSADTEPALPDWVLEGNAAAMETRVYPELDDLASTLQLRRWLWASRRSLLAESYAAQLLWRYLDVHSPRLLRIYLTRLAAQESDEDGAAALASAYGRLTGKPFAAAFAAFALTVADEHARELRPVTVLPPHASYRSAVARFAIHYLRLRIPKDGTYIVKVTLGRGSRGARVALSYQLESARPGEPAKSFRILPRASNASRTFAFTIPGRLRRNNRLTYPTLIVSNGAADSTATYSASSR